MCRFVFFKRMRNLHHFTWHLWPKPVSTSMIFIMPRFGLAHRIMALRVCGPTARTTTLHLLSRLMAITSKPFATHPIVHSITPL